MSRAKPATAQAIEQHYTPAEVAERLRLSTRTIERAIKSGAFSRAVFFGRRWSIPASDVEAWLAGFRASPARLPR